MRGEEDKTETVIYRRHITEKINWDRYYRQIKRNGGEYARLKRFDGSIVIFATLPISNEQIAPEDYTKILKEEYPLCQTVALSHGWSLYSPMKIQKIQEREKKYLDLIPFSEENAISTSELSKSINKPLSTLNPAISILFLSPNNNVRYYLNRKKVGTIYHYWQDNQPQNQNNSNYECRYCTEVFENKLAYARHIRNEHKEEIEEVRQIITIPDNPDMEVKKGPLNEYDTKIILLDERIAELEKSITIMQKRVTIYEREKRIEVLEKTLSKVTDRMKALGIEEAKLREGILK